jgi:hypothetical protein
MNKLLYTLHVMWYEHLMINETLDSLQSAISNSQMPVDVIVCLNSQTYIEKPDPGYDPITMFDEFKNHPVLKDATIINKTNDDEFYNIGDWARDIYGSEYDYKYIVWGESDCLIPEDYFFLLQHIKIKEPHVLSLANRKMWDSTWDELEHEWIRQFPRNGPPERPEQAPKPFNCADYISIDELNEFNRKYEPYVMTVSSQKIDGCMTALSKGLPLDFIHPELQIGGHDYYFELFMKKNNIPQYYIPTRLKGHNQVHPDKRVGTSTQRGNAEYVFYKTKCDELIHELIYNK